MMKVAQALFPMEKDSDRDVMANSKRLFTFRPLKTGTRKCIPYGIILTITMINYKKSGKASGKSKFTRCVGYWF